jgi:hypothetical protein
MIPNCSINFLISSALCTDALSIFTHQQHTFNRAGKESGPVHDVSSFSHHCAKTVSMYMANPPVSIHALGCQVITCPSSCCRYHHTFSNSSDGCTGWPFFLRLITGRSLVSLDRHKCSLPLRPCPCPCPGPYPQACPCPCPGPSQRPSASPCDDASTTDVEKTKMRDRDAGEKVSSLPGWRRTTTGRTRAKTGGELKISLARTSICHK